MVCIIPHLYEKKAFANLTLEFPPRGIIKAQFQILLVWLMVSTSNIPNINL